MARVGRRNTTNACLEFECARSVSKGELKQANLEAQRAVQPGSTRTATGMARNSYDADVVQTGRRFIMSLRPDRNHRNALHQHQRFPYAFVEAPSLAVFGFAAPRGASWWPSPRADDGHVLRSPRVGRVKPLGLDPPLKPLGLDPPLKPLGLDPPLKPLGLDPPLKPLGLDPGTSGLLRTTFSLPCCH